MFDDDCDDDDNEWPTRNVYEETTSHGGAEYPASVLDPDIDAAAIRTVERHCAIAHVRRNSARWALVG